MTYFLGQILNLRITYFFGTNGVFMNGAHPLVASSPSNTFAKANHNGVSCPCFQECHINFVEG
jgi:hypothetical protein